MTIIGVEDHKVPSTSPPTYAAVVASMPRPAQSNAQPIVPANSPAHTYEAPSQGMPASPLSPPPPSQRAYGPTPLPVAQSETTATALPYYDPRSPWAMQAAIGRAQRRFFGALFWGCVIWLAVGSLVGSAVDDVRQRRGSGRSWAVE